MGAHAFVEIAGTKGTVDGRHPAPVEVGSLSHYLQGLYISGVCLGFLNHQRRMD